MGKNKIKLSFMNDGKPFDIPHMTVKSQENLLEDMVGIEKEYKKDSEKYNREVNKHMVLRVLQGIDNSVSLDDINNMHPDDYLTLFNLIWSSGRELSDDGKFLGEREEATDKKE
jgi:hypothetical protein